MGCDILEDIDEAHAQASAHTRELTGTLRVHAPPMLASYVVAPLLSGFRSQYPNIQVDIDVGIIGVPAIKDYDVALLATKGKFAGALSFTAGVQFPAG